MDMQMRNRKLIMIYAVVLATSRSERAERARSRFFLSRSVCHCSFLAMSACTCVWLVFHRSPIDLPKKVSAFRRSSSSARASITVSSSLNAYVGFGESERTFKAWGLLLRKRETKFWHASVLTICPRPSKIRNDSEFQMLRKNSQVA